LSAVDTGGGVAKTLETPVDSDWFRFGRLSAAVAAVPGTSTCLYLLYASLVFLAVFVVDFNF